MKTGVVVFPGSNCDQDALYAAERATRVPGGDVAQAVPLWHESTDLRGCDAVILPGGFSYGDYLRTGAIARFAPIMPAIRRFAEAGRPVLGICNGFQILCEAGLLPGALMRNAALRFVCKPVYIRVETTDTPFTSACRAGQRLRVPVAHGEGSYVADDATLDNLERDRRVVFRYCDAVGDTTPSSNPNGSRRHIAGICSEGRNVVGLMPHPERAIEPALGSTDGVAVFASLVLHCSAALQGAAG